MLRGMLDVGRIGVLALHRAELEAKCTSIQHLSHAPCETSVQLKTKLDSSDGIRAKVIIVHLFCFPEQ